jgi:hypothetical protein
MSYDAWLQKPYTDRDWVQIVFDRFSSTAKFSSATDSNGNVYRSYLGVRKLIEAKS